VATEETHALGTKIFQHGDAGDSCTSSSRAKCVSAATCRAMGEEALAVLGPGQVFGEMALLDESPRSADARVHERCRLLAIRKTASTICSSSTKTWPTRFCGASCAMLVGRLRETTEKLTFLSISGKF